MSRRLSLRRRVERLEAILPNPAATTYRSAIVVMGFFDGDRHLVMTSSKAGFCQFQEAPGPGPQLADFGEFAQVLYLTPFEAES